MKHNKAILIVSACCAAAFLAATIVLGVFTGMSKTAKFDAKAISSHLSDKSYLEEGLSVPYETTEFALTVHVSPSGDDGNDGKDAPVKTVKRAQTVVRDYFAAGNEGNVCIELADGEYFVESPIALTNEDTLRGKLYIRSEHAGKATISGAKRIDRADIAEVNDEKLGRVWKISYDGTVNQLYLNGNYGIRARYPDAGTELRLLNWDDPMKKIYIDSDHIKDFTPEDIAGSTMFVSIMWAESYLRVEGIENRGKDTAVSLIPADRTIFERGNPNKYARQSYHFENSKAFLTSRGEWYYDAEEKTILYLPFDGETLDNTVVRVPESGQLLTITGAANYPVSGVTVEGVAFRYTSNDAVDGRLNGQSNKDDRHAEDPTCGRPVAAVLCNFVKDITFRGNIFACTGSTAVDLYKGADNVVIEKNIFHAVGGSGVLTGDVDYNIDNMSSDPATFLVNLNISENFLTDTCWQILGGSSINLNYAADSKVSHNTIYDNPYIGISVGWGWRTEAYPFLRNVEVSYNRVLNTMNFLSDGGGIYLVGAQPYSTVAHNYVANLFNSVYKFCEDIGPNAHPWWSTCGIYFDSGTGGVAEDDDVTAVDNWVDEETVDIMKYGTNNAKQQNFTVTEPAASEKDRIFRESGVTENGFTILPKRAFLTGCHTESAEVSAVYGENLGDKRDNGLVVMGKDGTYVQLAAKDILSWTDTCVRFKTKDYVSGLAWIITPEYISNTIKVTFNVDKDYEMHGQFNEKWGGISGLTRLLAMGQDLKNFTASSSDGIWEAKMIADGYTGTGWSSTTEDPFPWVGFELDIPATVEQVVLFSRTDIECQESLRRDFRIVGIPAVGEEVELFKCGHVPCFGAGDMFALRIPEQYEMTYWKGFRIERTRTRDDADYEQFGEDEVAAFDEDFYFFVAEVMVI